MSCNRYNLTKFFFFLNQINLSLLNLKLFYEYQKIIIFLIFPAYNNSFFLLNTF